MLQYINTQVYFLFYSLRVEYLNSLMIVITTFGSLIISGLLTIIVVYFLFKQKKNKYAYFLLANVIVGQFLVFIIKSLTNIPRPPLVDALVIENNSSFPSGHSMIAITLYFSILIILNRNVFNFPKLWKNIFKIIVSILIIMIPISRLYLGIHWLTDVIGALFLGLLQTLILLCIFKIKLPKDDKIRKLLYRYFK